MLLDYGICAVETVCELLQLRNAQDVFFSLYSLYQLYCKLSSHKFNMHGNKDTRI